MIVVEFAFGRCLTCGGALLPEFLVASEGGTLWHTTRSSIGRRRSGSVPTAAGRRSRECPVRWSAQHRKPGQEIPATGRASYAVTSSKPSAWRSRACLPHSQRSRTIGCPGFPARVDFTCTRTTARVFRSCGRLQYCPFVSIARWYRRKCRRHWKLRRSFPGRDRGPCQSRELAAARSWRQAARGRRARVPRPPRP